jgi:hypothetical protein
MRLRTIIWGWRLIGRSRRRCEDEVILGREKICLEVNRGGSGGYVQYPWGCIYMLGYLSSSVAWHRIA